MLQVFEGTLTTGGTVHFLWCLRNQDVVIGMVFVLFVGRYGVQFPSGERGLSVLQSVHMGSGATLWVPADFSRGIKQPECAAEAGQHKEDFSFVFLVNPLALQCSCLIHSL